MSAALRKLAVASSSAEPISLDAHRPKRRLAYRARRDVLEIAAVFGVCVLGLLGSFADSAIARTGFLLIGSGDDGAGNLDGMAATLVWAIVANIAACAGIVMIVYWFLSRPSAEVVELQSRRYKRKR